MLLLLYDDVGTGTHLPADETQHSRDKDTDASDTTDNTQIDTDTDRSWLTRAQEIFTQIWSTIQILIPRPSQSAVRYFVPVNPSQQKGLKIYFPERLKYSM